MFSRTSFSDKSVISAIVNVAQRMLWKQVTAPYDSDGGKSLIPAASISSRLTFLLIEYRTHSNNADLL